MSDRRETNRDEVLTKLRGLLEESEHGDTEGAHWQADQLLLDLIGDPEITAAFAALKKWYA